jgi:hypothetical protein
MGQRLAGAVPSRRPRGRGDRGRVRAAGRCQADGNREGFARIRSIRQLDDRHHLTLVCQDFAQLGRFVYVDNRVFRAIKAAT